MCAYLMTYQNADYDLLRWSVPWRWMKKKKHPDSIRRKDGAVWMF